MTPSLFRHIVSDIFFVLAYIGFAIHLGRYIGQLLKKKG